MEKRFYFGVGILALFLVLGLLTMKYMDKTNAGVVQTLEQAAQAAQAGDIARGRELADTARQRWKDGRRTVAAMADHKPMDEIDALFAQMEQYAVTGSEANFGACCARLAERIRSVADDHSLTWWNIL